MTLGSSGRADPAIGQIARSACANRPLTARRGDGRKIGRRPRPFARGRHATTISPASSSPTLTRIAQEQANAMAARDSLDHDVLAPFSSRISRSRFNRAAENIAYGHADFASTLKQWTNSTQHRANLLLRGAKWIGVAHALNGRRTYWAMVNGAEMKDSHSAR